MVLCDRISINGSPEEVWRLIEDPILMKAWNSKIRQIVPVSWGTRRSAGFRYRLRYELYNRESNFLAEIMEYQEPVKLVIHLTGGNLPVRGYAQEIYELSENEKGTLLRQSIEIHNSGMPLFAGTWLRGVHLFGKIAGKRHLRRLKALVEGAGEKV